MSDSLSRRQSIWSREALTDLCLSLFIRPARIEIKITNFKSRLSHLSLSLSFMHYVFPSLSLSFCIGNQVCRGVIPIKETKKRKFEKVVRLGSHSLSLGSLEIECHPISFGLSSMSFRLFTVRQNWGKESRTNDQGGFFNKCEGLAGFRGLGRE